MFNGFLNNTFARQLVLRPVRLMQPSVSYFHFPALSLLRTSDFSFSLPQFTNVPVSKVRFLLTVSLTAFIWRGRDCYEAKTGLTRAGCTQIFNLHWAFSKEYYGLWCAAPCFSMIYHCVLLQYALLHFAMLSPSSPSKSRPALAV